MPSIGFTFWQDGEMWLGNLDDDPDYLTQGTSFEDLKEHFLDLHRDLSSGVISSGAATRGTGSGVKRRI